MYMIGIGLVVKVIIMLQSHCIIILVIKLRSLVIKRGRVKEKFQLKTQNEKIPTTVNNPSVWGKWFNKSLRRWLGVPPSFSSVSLLQQISQPSNITISGGIQGG